MHFDTDGKRRGTATSRQDDNATHVDNYDHGRLPRIPILPPSPSPVWVLSGASGMRSLTNTRPLPWANDDYPSLTPLCELAHRHSLTTDAFRHRLHGRDGCERVVLYRHRHSR